jgi:hypothetical protein
MFSQAVRAVLAPFVRLWVRYSSQSWMALVRPVDHPSVHSRGSHADRLLMVGGGLSVGVGVLTHELSFSGYLARSVSRDSGRATDIDILADPYMTLNSCVTALRALELGRYDAIVTTVGGTAALTLAPLRTWKRGTAAMLDAIEQQAPDGVHVFVLGVAPLGKIVPLPFGLSTVIGSHIRLMNSVTAAVAAKRPHVTFLPLTASDFRPSLDNLDRNLYEDFAHLVSPNIARQLDISGGRSREGANANEALRQQALDDLAILDTEPEETYEWIAGMARDLFGASGASVTFIDNARQWVKAAVGVGRSDTPRALAFCEFTIRRSEVFVVEDTRLDDRFSAHPWVGGQGEGKVRFYAGYPLEAPNGQRVGALCIVDSKPRHFTNSEAALLRDLALQVQNALWRSHPRVSPEARP